MPNMFKRDYRINFTASFDNGATFHPGSVVVNASNTSEARHRFAEVLDQPGNDEHLVSVHCIVEAS